MALVDIKNTPCIPARTIYNPYKVSARRVLEAWGFGFHEPHPEDSRLIQVSLPEGHWSIIQYLHSPRDTFHIFGPHMEDRGFITYSEERCNLRLVTYYDIEITGDNIEGYSWCIKRDHFPIMLSSPLHIFDCRPTTRRRSSRHSVLKRRYG